jgi:GNAT superfamily N-acetyltransferase
MTVALRIANPNDAPSLWKLIERSAHELSVGCYSEIQVEALVRHVLGVDSRLIADRTYFVAVDREEILGCGGWSWRRTLYGGDQHLIVSPEVLDPTTEAARIRAFFVSPQHARSGIGRLLYQACEGAARLAGFRQLELVATLAGVPFYLALGFLAAERVTEILPDGTAVDFVRMTRRI